MLIVTRVNFNIESNKVVEIKIENSIMTQDFRISQKLLKIFTFSILTNLVLVNRQYKKVGEKNIKNLGFSTTICLRDLTS